MPNNTRGEALRQLERAVNGVEKAGQHLDWVDQVYAEQHPLIAEKARFLKDFALELQNGIIKLKGEL